MSKFYWNAAFGLLATLGWAGTAGAQTGGGMTGIGAYPAPRPYNQGAGSYVVAPGLPGAGGTYSYVQQNTGAGMGMSPNAYYSQNFFTSTPMTTNAPNAYSYSSRYSSPYTPPGVAAVPAQGTATTGYSAAPANNNVYSSANSSYYRTRRGGPLRRVFGR